MVILSLSLSPLEVPNFCIYKRLIVVINVAIQELGNYQMNTHNQDPVKRNTDSRLDDRLSFNKLTQKMVSFFLIPLGSCLTASESILKHFTSSSSSAFSYFNIFLPVLSSSSTIAS